MTTERIPTRISDAELQRRWTALRALMQAQNIDALVAQNNNDWLGGYVKWLTDIPAHNGYPRSVIFFADAPMVVVEMGAFGSSRKADAVHRGVGQIFGTPSFTSVNYTHDYDATLVAQSLRHHGCRRIGLIAAGAMPHRFVQVISDAGADIIDVTDEVDAMKAIKSAEEIDLIKSAAALQDAVFKTVLETIQPGMRDIDIIAAAQCAGQKLGSEQGIYLGGSAPLGQRASFLGRHMQGRTIQKGEHFSLLIEINGPGGFYTEIARTMVLGKAPVELLEGFAAVRAAQDHTLGLIKPGAACAGIAAAHNEYMKAHNLPPEIRLYAHGQGYDMVERPLIRHDETMHLAAGMCLAVHPGFETPGLFAVICDNYLVTEDGASACLHKTAKQIFELY